MKKVAMILSCVLGLTALSSFSMQIGKSERQLFRQDVASVIRHLKAKKDVSLTQQQQIDAMLDYAYKTGEIETFQALLKTWNDYRRASTRQRLFH